MRVVVGVTAYNRPAHLMACLKSVLASDPDVEVVVAIDHGLLQQGQVDYALSLGPNITVLQPGVKLGCAGNHRDLFREVFDVMGADAIIALEDDGVVAPDFIPVMRELLERYRDDEDVFSVCAWSRTGDGCPPAEGLARRQHFTAHTFGLWRRCWDEVVAQGGPVGVHWRAGDVSARYAKDRANEELWDDTLSSWAGSWAIPFNHVYRAGRWEVHTRLSRMEDRGPRGTFMNERLHAEIMVNEHWTGNVEPVDPSELSE